MKVWDDPWLSHEKRMQPQGPATCLTKGWKVCDLFHPDSVDWDEEKVSEVLPEFKDVILATKPSRSGGIDERVWLGTKDGSYSTKSGYQEALLDTSRRFPAPLKPNFNWFEQVWHLKCSPKIKIFLWKALNGALPSGSQLAVRISGLDPACVRCKEPESIAHILFNCHFARRVWLLAPLEGLNTIPVFTDVSVGLAWFRKKKNLPPEGLGHCDLFPWICWVLWTTRNKQIFNHTPFSEKETILKAIQDAREWQSAQDPSPQKSSSFPSKRASPEPPPSTLVIHSDAAWQGSSQRAGLGWTFSMMGNTFRRNTARCEHVSSPLVAEALAVRSALSLAVSLGFQDVLLLSDCQTLVKAISQKQTLLEIFGILWDISEYCNSFNSFCCCFIPRSSNVEADALAKDSLTLYSLL